VANNCAARYANADLNGERDSKSIVRRDAGTVGETAPEKRFWVKIPERPRTPQKLQAKTIIWAKIGSSLFANAPLNILGGGSWRWPNTPRIDANTREKVIRAEVGGAS